MLYAVFSTLMSRIGGAITFAMAFRPAHTRFALLRRTLLMTMVVLFSGAAAMAMIDRVKPAPLTFQTAQTATIVHVTPRVAATGDAPYVTQTRVQAGDRLSDVLQRLELADRASLLSFLTQAPEARSLTRLYPGLRISAATDGAGRLQWLRYLHPASGNVNGALQLVVEPGDTDTGYQAHEEAAQAQPEVRLTEGTIHGSLFATTDRLGIPDAITLQMADILQSKVDFLSGLRDGDRLRVVYELPTYAGQRLGAGRVLALQLVNQGRHYDAVWFQDNQGSGHYFDFHGAGLQGAFLKVPLTFTRISSSFGVRLHPLHKRWAKHKGVDYAAPTGTPIRATADAVVDFAGVQHGYGNVVILRHARHYTTVYAHQSRIAPGVRRGVAVRQGDVIGYVGQTGWATGPHLHYEVRHNAVAIDPKSLQTQASARLTAADLRAFKRQTAPYRAQIAMLTRRQTEELQ